MDDTRIDADLRSYDDDYHRWTLQQAAFLRSGRMNRVDLEHVAEEIESLGRSQESELASRYKVLCLHLLEQIVQPHLNGRSREATIAERRASIAVHLRKNPGLKSKRAGLFADGYEIARKTAKAETGLPLSAFPATPPFVIDEAEDETFVPRPAVRCPRSTGSRERRPCSSAPTRRPTWRPPPEGKSPRAGRTDDGAGIGVCPRVSVGADTTPGDVGPHRMNQRPL